MNYIFRMTQFQIAKQYPKAALILLTVIANIFGTVTLGAPVPVSAAGAHGPTLSYSCLWHKVRRGDTLLDLAWRYGVSVEAIKTANHLRGNRIYLGTFLCIPHPHTPPAPPPPQNNPWHGEYWNNTTQTGAPALSRYDADVNFNWGFGTPDAGRIYADSFSARWTQTYPFKGGTYRFTLVHDDGVRLYVGGNLLINEYDFVGVKASGIDVYLAAGAKVVTVDYVEKGGAARVRLDWVRLSLDGEPQPPPPPSSGGNWHADFFNNRDLIGAPVYVNNYGALNLVWGSGAPGPNMPADNWSARFTTARDFGGGNYRFVARVDDGIRVYLDGQLILNEWREQPNRTFVADTYISPGLHYVSVEYLEASGEAAVQLYWERR